MAQKRTHYYYYCYYYYYRHHHYHYTKATNKQRKATVNKIINWKHITKVVSLEWIGLSYVTAGNYGVLRPFQDGRAWVFHTQKKRRQFQAWKRKRPEKLRQLAILHGAWRKYVVRRLGRVYLWQSVVRITCKGKEDAARRNERGDEKTIKRFQSETFVNKEKGRKAINWQTGGLNHHWWTGVMKSADSLCLKSVGRLAINLKTKSEMKIEGGHKEKKNPRWKFVSSALQSFILYFFFLSFFF